MVRIIKLVIISLFVACSPMAVNADDLIGLIGGMSITSNPPAMQQMTGKSSFVDGNGGFCYLYHNQVTEGYAFETQVSMLCSSVSMLDSNDGETKVKFIVPLDFRWFLGTQTISAYLGLGLQYNCVWKFTEGESSYNTYYDPWWGYYQEENVGEEKWDWTVNQLSTNIALGFKVGFWNGDAYNPGKGVYEYFKRHAIIVGTKVHLPIINASESHGSGDGSVDLSRDKVGVSLTGALSFGFTDSFTLKLDYEYPLGGSNKYRLNDGGHATWFNTNTQSMSVTLLFRI